MTTRNYDITSIGSNIEFGIDGPRIKNNSGAFDFRNAADNDYAVIRVKAPTIDNDAANKKYVVDNFSASNHTHAYQPSDAGLTSLAGLTYVSTAFVKYTGIDTFTLDTTTYLPSSTYTASDVLAKIKTVDGVGSGLDAEYLGGNLHTTVRKILNSVTTN